MWHRQFVERSRRGACEECAHETAIPVLNEADFGRARWEIAGFDCWESYDDYQMEQDGWLLGFAMAGEHAIQVPISLEAFHSWRNHTGAPCDLASLQRFAEAVIWLRNHPGKPTETYIGPGQEMDRRQADDRSGRSGPFEEWLDCLGQAPSEGLKKAYARLLAESWISEWDDDRDCG